jgi:hypothetical protein
VISELVLSSVNTVFPKILKPLLKVVKAGKLKVVNPLFLILIEKSDIAVQPEPPPLPIVLSELAVSEVNFILSSIFKPPLKAVNEGKLKLVKPLFLIFIDRLVPTLKVPAPTVFRELAVSESNNIGGDCFKIFYSHKRI